MAMLPTAGDGRVVLNNRIEAITLRSVVQDDLTNSTDPASPAFGNTAFNRLVESRYSIYGNIYAGGGLGDACGRRNDGHLRGTHGHQRFCRAEQQIHRTLVQRCPACSLARVYFHGNGGQRAPVQFWNLSHSRCGGPRRRHDDRGAVHSINSLQLPVWMVVLSSASGPSTGPDPPAADYYIGGIPDR